MAGLGSIEAGELLMNPFLWFLVADGCRLCLRMSRSVK